VITTIAVYQDGPAPQKNPGAEKQSHQPILESDQSSDDPKLLEVPEKLPDPRANEAEDLDLEIKVEEGSEPIPKNDNDQPIEQPKEIENNQNNSIPQPPSEPQTTPKESTQNQDQANDQPTNTDPSWPPASENQQPIQQPAGSEFLDQGTDLDNINDDAPIQVNPENSDLPIEEQVQSSGVISEPEESILVPSQDASSPANSEPLDQLTAPAPSVNLPDLRPEISASDVNLETKTVNIAVRITNLTSIDPESAFSVTVYWDDGQVSSQSTQLGANLQFSTSYSQSGSYQIRVIVDSAGVIAEANETNNEAVKTIIIE
jgi:hypothetical protein